LIKLDFPELRLPKMAICRRLPLGVVCILMLLSAEDTGQKLACGCVLSA